MKSGAAVAPISPIAEATAGSLRYRVDVVSSRLDDVVRSAGGWLYDRSRAGWEVNVLLPSIEDVRALHILGVQACSLETGLNHRSGMRSHTLAIAAELTDRDERIRSVVRRSLRNNLTEVVVWGGPDLPTVDRLIPLQYRMTAAARAFKARALHAAGAGDPCVEPTELFVGGNRRLFPFDSDLTVVG